jgi:hypothetical protein
LYALIGAAYLLQFLIAKSLPGKVDNIYFLAAYNDVFNHLTSFFSGLEIRTSYFPEKAIYPFGSYPWAIGVIYSPLIYLDLSPYLSFYILYVIIFSTNALGVFLLSKSLKLNCTISFINGLIFSFSNYIVANFDNPDALIFFPGLVALSLLLSSNKKIVWSFILLAIQLYFSPYIFIFFCFAFLTYYVTNFKEIFVYTFLIKSIIGLIILSIIIAPFFYVYIVNTLSVEYYNPSFNIESQHYVGLKFKDFFKPLNSNLLYSGGEYSPQSNWLSKTKSIFSGFSIFIFSLFSLIFIKFENKIFWFSLLIIFFILSCGPYFPTEIPIENFLYNIYEYFGIHKFLRIPIRAFSIVLLSLIITSSFFLQSIFSKNKYLYYILVGFIIIENLSLKLETYNTQNYFSIQEQLKFIKPEDVVLNIPSDLYPILKNRMHNDGNCSLIDHEFSIIREYLYMYFQTKGKFNCINGFSSFIPLTRLENQKLIYNIDSNECIDELVLKNKLNYIIFFKEFKNGCPYHSFLNALNNNKNLIKFKENKHFIVFKVIFD